jgi:hypothetical protein
VGSLWDGTGNLWEYSTGQKLCARTDPPVIMVSCPICEQSVSQLKINDHIDSGCQSFIELLRARGVVVGRDGESLGVFDWAEALRADGG